MKTKIAMVLVIVASMLVLSVGAISINGFYRGKVAANEAANLTGYLKFNYTMPYVSNKTSSLDMLANVVQCRTTFAGRAVPIASSALKVNLNVSEVNSANSQLQADIKSNSSTRTIRGDLAIFNGDSLQLLGEALRASGNFNATQLSNLRSQLNDSTHSLADCISTNQTVRYIGLGVFTQGMSRGIGKWFHARR